MPGTVRNVTARLAGPHPGVLALPSMTRRNQGRCVLASLAHPLLAVVVSFQIQFLGDFIVRKALRALRYFSPEGFLEPRY